MMGYITDLTIFSAGHATVTGSIRYVSLESPSIDLSNDTSHDGVTDLKFI
jgi:hypothetical protein